MREFVRRHSVDVSILIANLASIGFAWNFPSELDPSLLVIVLTSLSQVGGVLVGLVGLIGLFAFDSLKSSSSEFDRHINELENSYWKIEWDAHKSGIEDRSVVTRMDSRVDELKEKKLRLIKSTKRGVLMFFTSLAFLLFEILVAIQGIAVVHDVAFSRLTLFLASDALLLGVFLAYYLTWTTTRIPTLTTPVD